jgi:hypothetical protein
MEKKKKTSCVFVIFITFIGEIAIDYPKESFLHSGRNDFNHNYLHHLGQ